ncbi:MAG TPA: hypothetical protein VFF64_18020 [Candidatus Eremiobacteraceae bacterium]|nr:hypothetical protein [Candidatus Eremiobacteraceae bacterium]
MKIDEWMPKYNVSACYSILVRASVEKTSAALESARFSDLPIVRRLMRLRGYRMDGNIDRNRATGSELSNSSNLNRRPYGAFLELSTVPQQEVVLGIAGRFWRPDGGIVRDLRPNEFVDFHREGFAKAVWTFSLAPADGGTQLGTETRVRTFGRSATLKFRAYWLLVGPFSGLIRKAMLREVKRIAERSPA